MILFFLKREKWMKYVEEVLGSGDPKKHPDWESSPKWFLARQRERGVPRGLSWIPMPGR